MKIAEKNQNWGGGTFQGLFAEGKFLFQLSRKYVGVASDFFPAGKSQVFQDPSPHPQTSPKFTLTDHAVSTCL